MSGLRRYWNLFRRSGYGFGLPRGSLSNYARTRAGRFGPRIGGEFPYPPLVFMYATRRCNLRCPFCVRGGWLSEPDGYELTPEIFRTALDNPFVARSAFICFNGGEPLLNESLPTFVRMARARGHLAGVNSNGTLLAERADELISSGLCDAQISVYDETKDALRGIFRQVRQVAPRLPLNASYVLTKSKLLGEARKNFSDLADTITMCRDSGCASIKFNIVNPPDGERDSPEIIRESDGQYARFIEKMRGSIDGASFSGYRTEGSRKRGRFEIFFPRPTADVCGGVRRACRTPWTMLSLDAKGNFGACCRMAPQEGGGDILRDPFGAANSPCAQALREPLLDGTKPLLGDCLNCNHLYGSYASRI